MTTKNNIPAGYKDSAVGIIPQEWDVKRVKDLGSVITGSTPPTADVSNYGSEYMFVSPADLSDNQKYVLSTEKMLSSKGYAISRKMPKGTILYTCIGSTIGKIGIASRELTSNQQINAVICNDKTEYLYYALLFTTGRIKMLAGEQAVPIINKSEFENIKLAVPPIEEQRKIAEILGVWDEAIEKQSRLIEKLELRKRALMQHLLTGRTRLSGFTSPWQKVKLGEIGKTYNGLTGKSKEDFEDGNAKFIPYINVFFNEKVNIDKLGVVSVDESEKQNKVQYGDIFFTVSSETPDEVGMASVLLEYIDDTYLNSFCFGYRLNDFETLNPIFASYILRGDRFRNYMMVLAQGSTRFNISKNEVMKLRIELPSLSEQKAIAEVLTMADKEIATHRKKLDALRLQKRGLMQQLLTGKTRVKI